jgi:uncharacterized membrane protein YcaP (DUF421 family)
MDMKSFNDIFIIGAPVLEKIIRITAVYFILVIGLRLSGKRELAQLNPFDFVVLLTLSNAVQNAIIGNDNSLTGGIISAAALLTLNYIVLRFIFGHRRIESLVDGKADVLIENGKILENIMKRELITVSELEMAAHKQGFSSIDDIERAILDPDGVISFTAKEPPKEKLRHDELVSILANIQAELAELKRVHGTNP